MPIDISETQARLLRLRAQRLDHSRETLTTVADVAHDVCGIQAQDTDQAALGVRVRSTGLTVADVDAARVAERSIVREYCMRNTLHFVSVADVPWLLSLFGPLYVKRGRTKLATVGLDDSDCERAMGIIRNAIAGQGPLTRPELAAELLASGFDFDSSGPASYRLVRRACLEGIVCKAGFRDGTETYALLDSWVSLDSAPDEETALAELARRYVAAYEPATLDDFYKWSGLYKNDARIGWAAIEDELTEVSIAGQQMWTLSVPDTAVKSDDTPIVRLLPKYDSYVLGHQDRALILPEEHTSQMQPRSTEIRATVLVDGRIVATWKLDRSRKTHSLSIHPFDTFTPAVESGIETEVEDIKRFLGSDIALEIHG